MTNRPYAKNAVFVQHNTEVTGSFSKVFISGSNTKLNVEFGTQTDPLTPEKPHVIKVESSTAYWYLDGPIKTIRVENGTAGVIAYTNK